MGTKIIDNALFIKMLRMGLNNLTKNREIINKLNVFPVPDGDTGTNMNLSLTSGVEEVEKVKNEPLSSIMTAFVRGLLMGARGNSGVILSQLFRGFATDITDETKLNTQTLAKAFQNGVTTAYQAVTNPVEGTILTVAKDAAAVAEKVAETEDDVIVLIEKVVAEAKASLDRTPELLDILKEVGVVDSGGQGLLVIYEGFLAALKGEDLPDVDDSQLDLDAMINLEHEKAVQSFIDIESIEHGYCTEFIIQLDAKKVEDNPFDETEFRSRLSEYGDSLLVAADKHHVKIHIHAEHPGDVMTIAQQYGDLIEIDIENMRQQYANIVNEPEATKGPADEIIDAGKYGIISVAAGKGLSETFYSIGASYIIEGGQTMNPSTEDVLSAINKVNAEHIIILPNNKNIVLAAKQAADLVEDKNITVIPSKNILQGINALLEFDETMSLDENEENMLTSFDDIKTGSVTFATRDTVINKIEVKENNFIGMNDETIVATDANKMKTTEQLIEKLIDLDEDEILTVFYGEDVTDDELTSLEAVLQEGYGDELEIEIHPGNQPVYSFLIMVN